MRRLARSLLRFCLLVGWASSLAAVCGLWAWSYFMREDAGWWWQDGPMSAVTTAVSVERGLVRVHRDTGHRARPSDVPLRFYWARAGAAADDRSPAAFRHRLGFGYARRTFPPRPFAEVTVIFPLWLIALALIAPVALGPVRRVVRASVRRGRGLCVSCGYDLRASPDRCPECGAAAKGSRAAGG
jgi:hypothetical protein